MKIKFLILAFSLINGLNANPVPLEDNRTPNHDRSRSDSSSTTPEQSNRPFGGWLTSDHEVANDRSQSNGNSSGCSRCDAKRSKK